jgi:hypothetical protein
MHLQLAAALVVATIFIASAHAAQPEGQIVVEREMPVHDAFQSAAPGAATTIATAPADLSATVSYGVAPQTISDAALGNVAASTGNQAARTLALSVAVPAAATAAPLPSMMLQGGVLQTSSVGSSVSAGLAPLGGMVSGLLGGSLK